MKKVILPLLIVAAFMAMGMQRNRYEPEKRLAYYAVDTASNDTYLAQVSGIDSYYAGLFILLNPVTANTDGCTLNINGLGALAIEGQDGNALTTNDILATGIYSLTHDGTNWLLQE